MLHIHIHLYIGIYSLCIFKNNTYHILFIYSGKKGSNNLQVLPNRYKIKVFTDVPTPTVYSSNIFKYLECLHYCNFP